MKFRIKSKSLLSFYFKKGLLFFLILTLLLSSITVGLIYFLCMNTVIVIPARNGFTEAYKVKIKILKVICDTGALIIYNNKFERTPLSGYVPGTSEYMTLNDIVLGYIFSYIGISIVLFSALYYCVFYFIIPITKRDILIYSTPSIKKRSIINSQMIVINIYQTITVSVICLIIQFFAITGIHSKDYQIRLVTLEIGFLLVTLISTNILSLITILFSRNAFIAVTAGIICCAVIIGLGYIDNYQEHFNMHDPNKSDELYKKWENRHNLLGFTYLISIVALLNNTFIFENNKFAYTENPLELSSIAKFNKDDTNFEKGISTFFRNADYDSYNLVVAIFKLGFAIFMLILFIRCAIVSYDYRIVWNLKIYEFKKIKITENKLKTSIKKNQNLNVN